ncbi:nuclear transport factor 2 family protein [Nonomuraea sp. NPDC004580]|uniref:nuclear transport factor 2 family protein n=1 Tax=Nonomuraea sp. NPDC004580 TaxID=3154552 RepID=UPI0033BCCE2B
MSVEEIVAAYHAAMLHKSPDELAGLYAEDGLHEFPFGAAPPFQGREEVSAKRPDRLRKREKRRHTRHQGVSASSR